MMATTIGRYDRLGHEATLGSLRGFGIRTLVAAVLGGGLADAAFALGVGWARSTGVAAASVGTWYLGLASHELRTFVSEAMRRIPSRDGLGGDVVAAVGAAAGFLVCVGAAVLAAAVHGGSPLAFGVSGVLVANAILTGTERTRAAEAADRRRQPPFAPMVGRTARVSARGAAGESVAAS